MTFEYRRMVAAALALAPLAACQTTGPAAAVVVEVEPATPAWARALSPEHLARLEAIDLYWASGLAAGQAAGFARRIRSEGALLDPAGGQAWATPSPGSYRCRRIRLGARGRQNGLSATGLFFCHIGDEGEQLSFTQQTGPERPGGYLSEDGGRRMIFIGALSRGREGVPPAYGEAPERDMVGLFERIGPFRYRLTLPREDGILDVIDLTALPPE